MSIKIIGAGFPRTGTNTLKRSLEILGYEKTYHFKDLILNPENLHYWETLRDTGTTKWDEIYDGYQGSVDFPCYPWYKEHMERIPRCQSHSYDQTIRKMVYQCQIHYLGFRSPNNS